jgi:hypothetical protein
MDWSMCLNAKTFQTKNIPAMIAKHAVTAVIRAAGFVSLTNHKNAAEIQTKKQCMDNYRMHCFQNI